MIQNMLYKILYSNKNDTQFKNSPVKIRGYRCHFSCIIFKNTTTGNISNETIKKYIEAQSKK